MLKGSHRFTCHPHVYPRMERAILPLLRKHSADGATRDRGNRHLIAAYYSFIDPERMKGGVGQRPDSQKNLRKNPKFIISFS